MTSPPAVGKRRSLTLLPTTEDQQLNLIAQEVIELCVFVETITEYSR
jgi:hypothetical protein